MIEDNNTENLPKKTLKDIVQEEDASGEQVKKNDIASLRARLEEYKMEVHSLQHRLKIRKRVIIALSICLVMVCAVLIAVVVYYFSNNLFNHSDNIASETPTQSETIVEVDPLEQQANDNDATAQYTLASRYLKGEGGYAVDVNQAMEWFNRAALNGEVNSMIALGDLYESGEMVNKNVKSAFRYYFMAAKQGDAKGLYKIGEYYMNGIAVEKDLEKAMLYLHRSAEQGYQQAKDLIGGVEKSSSSDTNSLKSSSVKNTPAEHKKEAE